MPVECEHPHFGLLFSNPLNDLNCSVVLAVNKLPALDFSYKLSWYPLFFFLFFSNMESEYKLVTSLKIWLVMRNCKDIDFNVEAGHIIKATKNVKLL